MISFILVMLASICNAVMDVITFHYDFSVFKKYNAVYWNPAISWKNKYVDWDNHNRLRRRFLFHLFAVPAAFTDAWHFFKSSMIVLLVLAIVLYEPFFGIAYDFVGMGLLWNIGFLLFYKRIFMID
jgi:hypothetical protein